MIAIEAHEQWRSHKHSPHISWRGPMAITSVPASGGLKINTRHPSGARSRVLLRHRSPLVYKHPAPPSLPSRSVARLGPNPSRYASSAMAASSLADGSIREVACFGALSVVRFTVSDPSLFFCCSFYRESSERLQPWGTTDFPFSLHLLCRASVRTVEMPISCRIWVICSCLVDCHGRIWSYRGSSILPLGDQCLRYLSCVSFDYHKLY